MRAVQTTKQARGVGRQVGLLWLGLAVFAGGCGSGGVSTTISSQPLSGKIGGQPWTFMTGETDSFQLSANQYSVDAYAESFTPCTGAASLTADSLFLNLPMAVGSYAVTFDLNQTFYIAATSDNLVATSGEIEITAISATTITGGANFAYDANNSVDGQFQASICP
jgi:hypothetical protein